MDLEKFYQSVPSFSVRIPFLSLVQNYLCTQARTPESGPRPRSSSAAPSPFAGAESVVTVTSSPGVRTHGGDPQVDLLSYPLLPVVSCLLRPATTSAPVSNSFSDMLLLQSTQTASARTLAITLNVHVELEASGPTASPYPNHSPLPTASSTVWTRHMLATPSCPAHALTP
jgi:hypothetical protein